MSMPIHLESRSLCPIHGAEKRMIECCVLDGVKGMSYLLAFDAETFSEIGKVTMDIAFPFWFHRTHVPG
jgi:hypothetical protein